MEMKDRIRQIMDDAKMSQQDFAAKLGISAASLSSIFTGRTRPTNNHVQAIHKAFPEININWLLFDEGDSHLSVVPAQVISEAPESDLVNASSPQAELGLLFSEPAIEQPLVQDRSLYTKRSKIEQNKEVNIIDRKIRKVREIRVFYDDGTYETFTPSPK